MDDYFEKAARFRERAITVMNESGIAGIWEKAGCRVEIVGSMRMGLMAKHRDIDLHTYSKEVTEERSFAIAATIARDPRIKEIKCINGLHTEEKCVAWHFSYEASDGEIWQFDVIHIIEGSRYDGFFEQMADRIARNSTREQKETILRLKFETPDIPAENESGDVAGDNTTGQIHGVEYYEAVIADGISTLEDLREWVVRHRATPSGYWMPE